MQNENPNGYLLSESAPITGLDNGIERWTRIQNGTDVVLCNRAFEHNVAAFSELSLAVRCQTEASTTSNSGNITLGAMVDNRAENVDGCLLTHYTLSFIFKKSI